MLVFGALCNIFPWLDRCISDYVTQREHTLEPGESETGTMRVEYNGEQFAIITSEDNSDRQVINNG